jgi:hypothetical protein
VGWGVARFAGAVEGALDGAEQLGPRHRLGDVLEAGEGSLAVAAHRLSAHGDDREPHRLVALAEARGHVEPGEARHPDVHQHDVRRPRRDSIERLFAARRGASALSRRGREGDDERGRPLGRLGHADLAAERLDGALAEVEAEARVAADVAARCGRG